MGRRQAGAAEPENGGDLVKTAPVLEVHGLSVRYGGGDEVLRGLDLSLVAGEAVGLLGPSGCGKSTLARVVLGLLPPPGRLTAGSIRVQGLEAAGWGRHEWRRVRGAVLALAQQEPSQALNPVRRIGGQIVAVLAAHGWRRRPARARALALLAEMGLGEAGRFARAYPHQLSGGQLQRACLAQALACGPALLIADEPTVGLDATTRGEVLAALRRRVAAGMALLLISHEAAVLEAVVDRTVALTGRAATVAGAGESDGSRSAANGGPQRPYPLAPGPRPQAALLRATGLRKAYRRAGRSLEALAGVDLEIAAGETVVLMGPSGAGKSTLARCLAGLERWDAGEVWRAPEARGRAVQVIWQDPAGALNPRLRLAEILAEPWRIAGGMPPAERRRRAAELLAQVGLPADWLGRRPAQLSGGEKRRVGIARALAVDPAVLILDEALASVEPGLQEALLRWLEDLQARRGLAYLFITHDPALAERFGGRRLRLAAGRIQEAACVAV